MQLKNDKFHDIETDIAIVAMNCRFPDADNIQEFWQNLSGGVNSVKVLGEKELRAMGLGDIVDENPNVKCAQSSLDKEKVKLFDAEFFNISPREAETMDPQQRLFLEACWEALEIAGYATEQYDGRIGVFGSTASSEYMARNLASNVDQLRDTGAFQVSLGNQKDFLATKVSYKMGFTGPSVNVNTLCSSSAVAIHMGRESLLNYQADIALVGAVNVTVDSVDSLYYNEAGIGAGDGRCRAYDERASGTVGGSGLAVIVLKRLEDALEDGDTILSLIKGTAVNNDGAHKASYTAPSPEGQAEVIAEALEIAGVDAATIGYVDGHGTGTNIGDPIEVSALSKAYRGYTQDKQFCALGSVKTNIGHLVTAGALASLIKSVLCMQHKKLVPSLNFERPNPKIDFENSPFYVNTELKDWQTQEHPRRAAVSSFGIGGTNVHIILQEAPEVVVKQSKVGSELVLLSAKSKRSLEMMKQNLLEYVSQNPEQSLSAVANTLALGRCAFEYKFSAIVNSMSSLGASLNSDGKISGSQSCRVSEQKKRLQAINLVAPAQFEEQLELSKLLSENSESYQSSLKDCLSAANAEVSEAQHKFSSWYAMLKMLEGFTVAVDGIYNDWTGEFALACAKQAMSLPDAMKLIDSLDTVINSSANLDNFERVLADIHFTSETYNWFSSILSCVVSESTVAHWRAVARKLMSGMNANQELEKHKIFLHLDRNGLSEGDRMFLSQEHTYHDLLGQLWHLGIPMRWQALYQGLDIRRVPLPTYAFDRKVHWIEAKPMTTGVVKENDVVVQDLNELKDTTNLGQQFDTGSISIDLGFSDDIATQKLQIAAVLELKGQLDSICHELRSNLGIKLNISGLGLNYVQGIEQAASSVDKAQRSERPGHLASVYTAPVTSLQIDLVEEFQEALGIEPIGIDDNFFELGGHSLMASVLVNRIQTASKVAIDVSELMMNATIAEFSELLEAKLMVNEDIEESQGAGQTLVL